MRTLGILIAILLVGGAGWILRRLGADADPVHVDIAPEDLDQMVMREIPRLHIDRLPKGGAEVWFEYCDRVDVSAWDPSRLCFDQWPDSLPPSALLDAERECAAWSRLCSPRAWAEA